MNKISNRMFKSNGVRSSSFLLSLLLISACAPTYINTPIDEKDLVHGKDLLAKKIPENRALMEFTTNSSVPTTLAEVVGTSACTASEKIPLASAVKAFVPSEPENERVLDGNVRWYKGAGLGKFRAYAYAPEQTYFYVTAEKPLVLSALAKLETGNGTSTTMMSCGPLYIRFQPQANHRYRYTFVGKGRQCISRLEEWGGDGGFRAIPFESWTCNGATPVKL